MAQRTWGTAVMNSSYSTATNWHESSVPVNADEVTIAGGNATAITSGLDQSAVSLDSFETQPDYSSIIGSYFENLKIVTAKFRFNSLGVSYIDIGTSNIVAHVDGTATPSTGGRGLYLIGSAASVLAVNGGHVGFAWRRNETSTATTIRVAGSGTTFWGGEGITNTTYEQADGSNVIHFGNTTTNVNGGTLITRGSGAITTLNCYGGYTYPNSTGTITTLNAFPGSYVDFTTSKAARTVTTINIYPGAHVLWDTAVLTLTNAPVWLGGDVSILTAKPTDAGAWIYQRSGAF